MELFANPQNGKWALIGKSKDPKMPSDEICVLASSSIVPYAKERWFTAYFQQAAPVSPKVAVAPAGAKPQVN